MRIAILNEFFYPVVTGGTEIFLHEFSKYLDKKGHEIIVISTNKTKEFKSYELKSSPFHIGHFYQIPGLTLPFMFSSKNYKTVRSILKKEKIDMVYANNIYHLSISALRSAIEYGKTILDIHDYWPVCFAKDKFFMGKKLCKVENPIKCSICLFKKFKFPSPLLIPFLYEEKKKRDKILSRVSNTIVHSQFVKDQVKHIFPNSKVIPYPLMIKGKNKRKGKDKLKLLFVGRINYNKGADLVLEVAKFLKGKIDFEINVIGEGPLKKKLDKPDLNIYVRGFMGKERFKYFEESHIMLAPSRWPEPFGIIALEASAYSLPVVTLKQSGGLREIVENNKIGVATTPEKIGETVLKVFNSIKDFGHGFKIVKNKYEQKKIFKQYEKVLKN